AFEVDYVYDALRTKPKVDFKKGRQEDAEECLGFLLDGLNEELLLARRSAMALCRSNSNGKAVSPTSSDRTLSDSNIEGPMEVSETPIGQIFGGKMRTMLKAGDDKGKAMVEQFMALPLDIAPDHILSVEDGLLNLTAPEIIPGYASTTGFPMGVTKQSYFDTFPQVLILHMKRFVFDFKTGSTKKLRDHILFNTSLKINPEIVSPAGMNQHVEYALSAGKALNHLGGAIGRMPNYAFIPQ
ncbi:hypothetical protein HDU81_008328, partial [Chytriomyces hyalinus]